MKSAAIHSLWLLLPMLFGWWVVGRWTGQASMKPAETKVSLAASPAEQTLHSRVNWKQDFPAITPEWEDYVCMLATSRDAAFLWRCYQSQGDEGVDGLIQRRLVELSVEDALAKALTDSSSNADTWGEAFAAGWAIHQTDEALITFVKNLAPQLSKYTTASPVWILRSLNRRLGGSRVLSLALATDFAGLPEVCHYLFRELAQANPSEAHAALAKVTTAPMLAAARLGYWGGLAHSRPAEALALLEAPDFTANQPPELLTTVLEKNAALLLPLLAKRPDLRNEDFLKNLAHKLGKDTSAVAWANSVLEGRTRRDFLFALSYAQMDTPSRALDTLALVPEKERHQYLKANPGRFGPEVQEHPILQRYRLLNFTAEEAGEIKKLAKTDADAAVALANEKVRKMTHDDLKTIARSVADADPAAAWTLLADRLPKVPKFSRDTDLRAQGWDIFDKWASQDPAAAAQWTQGNPAALPETKVPELLGWLADADEAKARAFINTLTKPEQQQQAQRILQEAQAWKDLADGKLSP